MLTEDHSNSNENYRENLIKITRSWNCQGLDFVTGKVSCGESRKFKNEKERDTWIRIHNKRCNDCKSIKNK
jgi:hypothetical protein